MSNNILTFGEVLMRISPSNHKTLQQSKEVEFFFGGTEMNVAASLSTFGCKTQHISNVSNDFVGDAAISYMKSLGIDVSFITKNEHPLGLYFLEVGSDVRASRVAYNRLNGSFSNIKPKEVDWNKALENSNFFHWTGITPGISESAYETLKQGLQFAYSKGINITTDPAYRSNLWNYGKKGQDILKELIGYSTIFIGGVNEINEILETNFSTDKKGFIEASKTLMKEIPSIQKVFDKVRIGFNASSQATQGRAWINNEYLETEEIQINHVVDRIGTGDAFAAGLIYGLINHDDQFALNFANAACAMKHTILGDINLVSVDDILELVNGNFGGRIKR